MVQRRVYRIWRSCYQPHPDPSAYASDGPADFGAAFEAALVAALAALLAALEAMVWLLYVRWRGALCRLLGSPAGSRRSSVLAGRLSTRGQLSVCFCTNFGNILL